MGSFKKVKVIKGRGRIKGRRVVKGRGRIKGSRVIKEGRRLRIGVGSGFGLESAYHYYSHVSFRGTILEEAASLCGAGSWGTKKQIRPLYRAI